MFIKVENKILNTSRIESIIECEGEIRIYMTGYDITTFFSFAETSIDEIYEMMRGV